MEKRELEEMKVSIYEKLRRAIKQGDKEKALGLLEEIDRNRNKDLEMFVAWVDVLLTYGADKLGEEMVNETQRICFERGIYPGIEAALELVNAEDRFRKRVNAFTMVHGWNIDEIEEDEEKFIIKFKCLTGGSLRAKEHAGKTKEAHSWSYGQKGFCYYCAHCSIDYEIIAIEKFGYPAWIHLPQPDGRCIQYLYKNPESVPDEYYRRVGMGKKRVSG